MYLHIPSISRFLQNSKEAKTDSIQILNSSSLASLLRCFNYRYHIPGIFSTFLSFRL